MANIKSNIPNFLSQPLKRNYIGAISRTITLDLNPSPQIDIPHHIFFFFVRLLTNYHFCHFPIIGQKRIDLLWLN